MAIHIDRELCTGCGTCVDACPAGAIQMLGGCRAIDDALCNACEACMAVCPNGAITRSAIQEPVVPSVALVTGMSQSQLTYTPASREKSLGSAGSLTPLAGAALAFLGREVAPRLVDMLLNALERKLTGPVTTSVGQSFGHAGRFPGKGKGLHRRVRFHGGKAGRKLSEESKKSLSTKGG